MNVSEMKGFLKRLDKHRVRVSGDIEHKIESFHGVRMSEVYGNLEHPNNLINVEVQESRRKHDETYGLYFQPVTPEKTMRKKLRVVVTYKSLKKLFYIVTAHYITRKTEKLSKQAKARRRRRWRR